MLCFPHVKVRQNINELIIHNIHGINIYHVSIVIIALMESTEFSIGYGIVIKIYNQFGYIKEQMNI